MNISKMKRSTQIAILTGAGSGAVEKTVTGTAPLTLSDSVAGNILNFNVKGHSEVSSESIISVGDAGWGVVDLGTLTWIKDKSRFRSDTISNQIKSVSAWNEPSSINSKYETGAVPASDGDNKKLGIYQAVIYIRDSDYDDATTFESAMSGVLLYYPLADATGATPILGIISKDGAGQGAVATITTGLPLRSTLDGTVYDELTSTKVITRCEVVDNEVVPLAEPVEIPLSSAEIAALTALKTYDPTTVIPVTDNPSITVKYMGKNITRTAPKKRSSRKKKA